MSIDLCLIFSWGIFATKFIAKRSFLLEYPGQLISSKEAERRKKIYAKRKLGSYVFSLVKKGKRFGKAYLYYLKHIFIV